MKPLNGDGWNSKNFRSETKARLKPAGMVLGCHTSGVPAALGRAQALHLVLCLTVLGCEKAGDTGATSVGDNDSGTRHSSDETARMGFIGSPCTVDGDCDYDGAVCLTEGFPNGLCSMPCDTRCPDRDGHPVTFCVDGGAAGGGFPDDDGWCVSRCSFAAYEETGCRQDYGCTVQGRNSEPWTETFSCLPYATPDLSECHYRLAERGVGFEPTVWPEDHPAGHPELTCSIADPVWVLSPVEGVVLEYYDGTPTPRTLASCEAAHSIADTALDAAASGVEAILHMGTYNCRVIAGTSSLSRHGHGDAFDVFGFRFSDGTEWSLIEHWEHDTESPVSDAGAFLYDAAYRWYDQWIWNIILTPNYNAAHDNHFHLDLTPGWHDLSAHDGRYIGPAPYAD